MEKEPRPRWTWMIEALFTLLFGCWHRRTSWPITRKRDQKQPIGESQTWTYIVCLDCGKEFSYDWTRMQVVESTRQQRTPQNVPTIELNDHAGKVGPKVIVRWNGCLARVLTGYENCVEDNQIESRHPPTGGLAGKHR